MTSTNAPPLPPDRGALSMKEAARWLGVSEKTVWSMTASGELPHVRIRSRVLYPVDLLRDWLRENAQGGARDDTR